jgi:hypothetical protein
MWSALPKTQDCVVTVCYSTWDDTLIDAIVAVTKCGVSLYGRVSQGGVVYMEKIKNRLLPLLTPLFFVWNISLKGHAMRRIFRGFCRNWFLMIPLHYLSSRSGFCFKFAEIFVFDNDSPLSPIWRVSY